MCNQKYQVNNVVPFSTSAADSALRIKSKSSVVGTSRWLSIITLVLKEVGHFYKNLLVVVSPNRSLKSCSICNTDTYKQRVTMRVTALWLYWELPWNNLIKMLYKSWCVQKTWGNQEDICWFAFIIDYCLAISEGRFHLLTDSVFIGTVFVLVPQLKTKHNVTLARTSNNSQV